MLSFAVAMLAAADFGLSMIVSPAYLISVKSGFLTFGQAEYILQAALFIFLCFSLKGFKPIYLISFLSGFFYGTVLDLWRLIIPHFNPELTKPEEINFYLRIVYFIVGLLLTTFSIAMFFRSYIYPQVYDFFVKALSEKYNIKIKSIKLVNDFVFLIVSVVLSIVFFKKLVGVGIGTFIAAFLNGYLINWFGNLIDKFFIIQPRFEKLSKKMTI
jgi:uncharacterized membrane protein YczE